MQMTHFWLERRNPRREKDKKTHGKTGGGRWQELENVGITGPLSPPRGGSRAFTSLTIVIDQVLMQIKDEGALTFPGKLKGDPNKRSRDKYCRFHQDHDHDIANCYDLK